MTFKAGDWVLYGDQYACVHGATKGSRWLIELPLWDTDPIYINRHWVMPNSIKPLDPAISDILRSIYNV